MTRVSDWGLNMDVVKNFSIFEKIEIRPRRVRARRAGLRSLWEREE